MGKAVDKEKINWGIIATGRIAHEFADTLRKVPDAALAAVGSSSMEKSSAFCERFGGRAYGSYEQVVQDPDVDVVYVATPHPIHEANVLMSAQAEKAILCEKPFAANYKQARNMIQTARKHGVFLMEGLWSRFFPAWDYVRALLRSGELGDIYSIDSATCWGIQQISPSQHRLLDPALAGGALLDAGVYSLAAITDVLRDFGEPKYLSSVMKLGPEGVDEHAAVLMNFAGHIPAVAICGLYGFEFETRIVCRHGTISIPRHRNPDRVRIIRREAKSFLVNAAEEERLFPFEGSGFQFIIAAVHRCLREGLNECPMAPLEETLLLSRLCDFIRADAGLVYPFEIT